MWHNTPNGSLGQLAFDNFPSGQNALTELQAIFEFASSGTRSPMQDLRDCLTTCQQVEGKSPEECQKRCKSLTPGETGPGFWESFFGGFQIPGQTRNIGVIVLGIVLVIIALALISR